MARVLVGEGTIGTTGRVGEEWGVEGRVVVAPPVSELLSTDTELLTVTADMRGY